MQSVPSALCCAGACGIPSDVDFGLKPVFQLQTISAAFVQLVGTATNLVFELLFCCGRLAGFFHREGWHRSSLRRFSCWTPKTKEQRKLFVQSSHPNLHPVHIQCQLSVQRSASDPATIESRRSQLRAHFLNIFSHLFDCAAMRRHKLALNTAPELV